MKSPSNLKTKKHQNNNIMNEELKKLLQIAVRFIEDNGLYEEFKKNLPLGNELEKAFYTSKDVSKWADLE